MDIFMGEVFGVLIIIFYALALLNFCFKFLNRNFKETLKKNEQFYKYYMNLLKFFMKFHRYFGGVAVLMIIVHFIIQFSMYGINLTGGIAAGTMFLQIGLGIYGQVKKVKNKAWLMIHRGIAGLLLIMILIHIL